MVKPSLTYLLLIIFITTQGQSVNFKNPILTGFNPDPSICRVKDDYYLVTSSFVMFPALPLYHSKDLINWERIGFGITRQNEMQFNGVKDKNGIWAPTLRYHDGLFYLITTCYQCGGNFYITAKDPKGPWSDPVWLKDIPGIDPSLMWDDDGRCYYTGNDFTNTPKSWPSQVAIWVQELDLKQQKFIGEKKVLTYGYANNATFAEGPHLYKVDGKYLLLISEGGTDQYHALTAHHSSSVLGPYTADKINPVLSHRQLGTDYPIQAVGHADLVQTQNGEWWAVSLGKRVVNGEVPLARETFLSQVKMEEEAPIFNPGHGIVLMEQRRPNLPWTPFKPLPFKDEFEGDSLGLNWEFVRVPKKQFHQLRGGQLIIDVHPQIADSLVSPSMIVQRIKHFQYEATTKLAFKPARENEQAGLIIYRGSENYYLLVKSKEQILLIKNQNSKKEIVAQLPYTKQEIFLRATVDSLTVRFSFGETAEKMNVIGDTQSLMVISENKINRFNGPVIGLYATSNGAETKAKALVDWFEYKPVNELKN